MAVVAVMVVMVMMAHLIHLHRHGQQNLAQEHCDGAESLLVKQTMESKLAQQRIEAIMSQLVQTNKEKLEAQEHWQRNLV